MSSRTSRTSNRERHGRDEDQYVLVITEVSPSLQWQDFKDAVRRAGAMHVRRVHVEPTVPDNTLVGQCEIKGWENALRVYDIFLAAGLNGCQIRLVLCRKVGENGLDRLKGPEPSRNRVYPRTLARPANMASAAMPSVSPGRRYLPTREMSAMATSVVTPPPSGSRISTINRLVSGQPSNLMVPVRTNPQYRPPPPPLRPTSVTFRSPYHSVQVGDIERLLQKINVSPTHRFVDGTSIKAIFSNMAVAQHTCQHLDGKMLRGKPLQVTLDPDVAERSSRTETRPRPPAPFRPDAPAFVPSPQGRQTDRPLIVNGSGNSFRRSRYVPDSDDEED